MYSLSWSETACPMQWLLCCASLYPEFWVAVPFTLWAAVLTVKALCALRVSLGVSWYSLQVPGAVTVTPWGGERSALGTCWAEPPGHSWAPHGTRSHGALQGEQEKAEAQPRRSSWGILVPRAFPGILFLSLQVISRLSQPLWTVMSPCPAYLILHAISVRSNCLLSTVCSQSLF